ncbi:MAG TPA: matrixin family metalloprotease [Vicinamibacterales bacterium]
MRFLTGLIVAASIAVPRLCDASTVLYRSDAELIAISERVVHARVVAQRAIRAEQPSPRIYTVTTLSLIEDFTGMPGDTIEVWELGGAVGGEIFFVGGEVQYRIGQEVLVCLGRGRQGLRSVAMGFSKFDVVRTPNGDAALQREVKDTFVVGGVVPARERSLTEFRQLAASVLRRPSRRAAIDPAMPATIAQPFTTLPGGIPGWRWREADMGIPLRVFKNTSRPNPLLSGDAVPEIEIAVAAWTNPTQASIILNYAGTASEPVPDGGWTTIPSRSTLISFEDPMDDIDFPVLAIGGGAATVGTGGTIGGQTWDGFTSAFVVFQNANDLDTTFRQSRDFTRVLTHEIGHTIGFGHTQNDGSVVNPTSNLMYASCCYPETPIPPALGADDLLGLRTMYPAGTPSGPTMALDKTSLRFGAIVSGGGFAGQTAGQIVRLTQTGSGTVTWTATSSRPWLVVSRTSGTGPAELTLNVLSDPTLPQSGIEDGAIVFTFTGASNSPGPIAVRLTLFVVGMSTGPIGAVDTPMNNATGVTGAVPFTGWSLDDIQTMRVNVCRSPVTGEGAAGSELCAGNAEIYVGSAVFIDGARPDVSSAFPTYPLNSRGGWGLMVLTNMLPGQGNGTYRFSIYAQDREANFVRLSTRTLTCDNAHATKPFGTIDTPDQGAVISGANYINFGWALTPPGATPPGKMIPINGSTMRVLVDGVSRGTVDYNHERADIETLFPNYRNTEGSNGPVGFRPIDTTALSNGVHTISWTVTDDAGLTEGIGSRFFTVANSAGSVTAAPQTAAARADDRAAVESAPLSFASVRARRGWGSTAPWKDYPASASGRTLIRGEEVDRFEVMLDRQNGARYTGYVRAAGELTTLPAGSTLDAATGRFTWAPGAGFVGSYDLVFVEWMGDVPRSRHEVRIVLGPKTSGLVGTQVVIDTPRSQQDVAQPFMLAGWAADLSSPRGTGVSGLHVWAYPLNGGAPVFLGAATYGGARPDVAAVHGDDRRESGFGLIVSGLAHGNYDLAIFPWSIEAGDFLPATVVRLTVR